MSLLLCPRYDLGAAADGAPTVLGDFEVDDMLFPSWTIGNDGLTYEHNTDPGGSVRDGFWLDPQVGMDLYECMATPTSTQRPNTGTFNTWLDLAQTWSWGFVATALQQRQWQLGIMPSKSGSFAIEIRRKSDQVVVTAFNVTLIQSGSNG